MPLFLKSNNLIDKFEDFVAGNFMAHHVTFGDFMAGNFLAGDFLGWIRLKSLPNQSLPHKRKCQEPMDKTRSQRGNRAQDSRWLCLVSGGWALSQYFPSENKQSNDFILSVNIYIYMAFGIKQHDKSLIKRKPY